MDVHRVMFFRKIGFYFKKLLRGQFPGLIGFEPSYFCSRNAIDLFWKKDKVMAIFMDNQSPPNPPCIDKEFKPIPFFDFREKGFFKPYLYPYFEIDPLFFATFALPQPLRFAPVMGARFFRF